jgi:membrane protein
MAISYYIGRASIGSAYGAAGSLMVLLVWVYYSSLIFFYGAEFTQVWASQHHLVVPKPYAVEGAAPQHRSEAQDDPAGVQHLDDPQDVTPSRRSGETR